MSWAYRQRWSGGSERRLPGCRAGSAPTLPRAGSLQEAYLRRQMQDSLLRGGSPTQPIPISEERQDRAPAHERASQQ